MTRRIKNLCCHCSRRCKVIDRSGNSRTVRCRTCRRCSLIIEHPAFSDGIALRDFHLVRGKGERQRPLRVQLEAKDLVHCLQRDCYLSSDLVADFGIASCKHRAALLAAVQAGVTAYDLDRVMRDGPAITRLVRSIPAPPEPDIEFATEFDGWEWWTWPTELAL